MSLMATPVALLAAGSYSSSMSGAGNTIRPAFAPARAAFQLTVTSAPSTSTLSSATLDVYLQHSIDSSQASPVWDAFLRFPQITAGPTQVASQIASWNGLIAASSSQNQHAANSSNLAAGYVINGALGGSWRVAYVIANGPSAPSSSCYAFSVVAQLHQ